MGAKKTILVAPLCWGLGHATRCIPIIDALLAHGFNVIIGSDGDALLLLRKEFPQLPYVSLPAYNIRYPKKGVYFKWKLLWKLPALQKTMRSEKKIIQKMVAQGTIDGIISDNRLGVRNKKIPSVFITHQLNVLTGHTSFFSSKLHRRIIRKFDACWVPDVENIINLSGKLGHIKHADFPVTYIGPLSRMKKQLLPKQYDILVLLSGPEPQRSMLELQLTELFSKAANSVLLVQGNVQSQQEIRQLNNLKIVNYMLSEELEQAINASDLVVSRSGYTTIMDLAVLEKKAFFIPTPGQYEQNYLAKRLDDHGLVPMCKQKEFSIDKLESVRDYKGLHDFKSQRDYEALFSFFKGKGEL
ncbi:glycosyltransferase [Candidatus Ulvibacter alkanivorans]|uniref:glycosyltransferase n=1 Tax=Candidatus Ulvibacter alkanivorans TaxID=2267620 RepID=UPI000DF35F1D|nr:glycosyltransferase [Candidatus Ulvibacter alkanivorans]